MARLIFDLDGTLVHSAPTIAAAANGMLGEIGRTALPLAAVLGYVGHGMRRLVEDVLNETGGVPEAGVDHHLAIYRRIYFADPLTGTELYPGVAEALATLAAAGHDLALEFNQGQVPGIGRRLQDTLAAHGVPVPDQARVTPEGFGRGQVFGPVLRPQPGLGIPKGGDAALGRDAGPGQHRNAIGFAQGSDQARIEVRDIHLQENGRTGEIQRGSKCHVCSPPFLLFSCKRLNDTRFGLGRKTARIGLGEHAAALGDHTNGSSSPLPKTFLRALAWAGVSSATAYWA